MLQVHLRRYLIVLALLLAPPAFAQDEFLAPTDEDNVTTFQIENGSNCGGTGCGSQNCALLVDEDPDGTPTDAVVVDNNATNTILWDMDDPASDVSEVAGDQGIELNVSKQNTTCVETTGGGTPTFDVELYCAGVPKLTVGGADAIITDRSITSEDLFISGDTWTYTVDGDCLADGSTVEFNFITHRNGGGGNRRNVILNSIQWNVTHAAAGGTRNRFKLIGDNNKEQEYELASQDIREQVDQRQQEVHRRAGGAGDHVRRNPGANTGGHVPSRVAYTRAGWIRRGGSHSQQDGEVERLR